MPGPQEAHQDGGFLGPPREIVRAAVFVSAGIVLVFEVISLPVRGRRYVPANPCPDLERLVDFLLGRVDEASADVLGQHLQSCADCQTTMDACYGQEDTLVSALRKNAVMSDSGSSGGERGRFEAEPELQRVLDQLNAAPMEFPQLSSNRQDLPDLQLEGQARFGQYRLLELLGKGGMGAVFKAEHTQLEMTVAIKVLSERLVGDPHAVKRFAREMKAVGKVNHANIVRATDAGQHNGRHFIAMEFVDGCDLGQILDAVGPLPIPDACEVIRQAAMGVAHAHELGLIHRDLKPSNLMLTRDGQVKVLDLGLARLHHDQAGGGLTDEFQVMGTADYMAPEQALRPKDVDARADIYSLGCTLYALLCGNPPFSGSAYDHPLQKLAGHGRDQPTSVLKSRPDVPTDLSTLVDRAMAKSPVDRWQSMAALAAALQPIAVKANLPALLPVWESPKPADQTSDTRKLVAITDAVAGDAKRSRLRQPSLRLYASIGVMVLIAVGTAVSHWLPDRLDQKGDAERSRDADRPVAAAPSRPPPAKAPFDTRQAESYQQAWADQLGLPVEVVNSLEMRMRLIPPGEFMMGTRHFEVQQTIATTNDEQVRFESPQRQVTITKPFYIGTCEVTRGQFRVFMEDKQYITDSERDGTGGWGLSDGQIVKDSAFSWSHLGYQQTDAHPVVNVSWNDAVAFCNWLSAREGTTYQLPTEAQWEYACRAGTVTPFSFHGDLLESHAWFNETGQLHPPVEFIGTKAVGQKRANPFGLLDVHGNAWEWCSDWGGFYPGRAETDPVGPPEGARHVIRGGSWYKSPVESRSAYRAMLAPDVRFSDVGFRVIALQSP